MNKKMEGVMKRGTRRKEGREREKERGGETRGEGVMVRV